MNSKNRLPEYEMAKGIGILLVIIGHLLPGENYVRWVIYSFHMPLFFFLNGMFLNENKKIDVRKYLVNYGMWSIVYIIFDIVFNYLIIKETTLRIIALNIYSTFCLFGMSVLWFISSLMIGRVIAIYVLRNIKSKALLSMVVLICYFMPIKIWKMCDVLPYGIEQELIYYPLNFLLRTLTCSSFILLGKLLNDLIKIIMANRYSHLGIVLLFFNIIGAKYVSLIDYRKMEIDIPILAFILSFIGIISVCCLGKSLMNLSICKRNLLFLSANSLFIMETHEYLVKKILKTVIHINDSIIEFMVLFLGILLLEVILIKFVKNKMIKLENWLIGKFMYIV